MTIVRTVAEAAAVDENDLDPLEDVLSADALNRLVSGSDAQLSFEYEGYAVDVDGDIVTVYPVNSSPESASDD